jgi:hypothetical protein
VVQRFDTIESHVVVGKPFADHVCDFINGFLDGGFHILLGCGYFPNCFHRFNQSCDL